MLDYFVVISIIYIIFYHLLLVFTQAFSNIFIIDYIYPCVTNLINTCVQYVIHYYNSFIDSSYACKCRRLYTYIHSSKSQLTANLYNDNSVFLLSLLTCPICYNMYDKIYMCPNGHSVCNKCFNTSKICSFCRTNINSLTRNRVLEEMLENMVLPCSYYKHGCKKCILNNVRSAHENHCKFKPISCHLDTCTYKANYSDMLRHIPHGHNHVDIIKSDSGPACIYHKFKFNFNVPDRIKFDNLNENANVFKILDVNGNTLIFIKWFIRYGLLKNLQYDPDGSNALCKNKALCFALLSTHNNKFNINIYNKNSDKFGKYTLLNKLKNVIDYNNTIAIPLNSVYDNMDTDFRIDINIYNKIKHVKVL